MREPTRRLTATNGHWAFRSALAGLCTLLAFAVAHPVHALEITTTSIIGYGATLRPDGFFLTPNHPSAFPLNASGVVAINTRYSAYPNEGNGFLLTDNGLTFNSVDAAGPGSFLELVGFAINNVDTLTYQRGPIFQGLPVYRQLFNLASPYTNGVTMASEPYASAAVNLYTNSAGQGVTVLEGASAPDGLSRVVRLNGNGTTTDLAIDPRFFATGTRQAKILENGDIYVALLNYDSQRYEIWRFVAGESQTHAVVYSASVAEAALTAWDVNASGGLVVAEADSAGNNIVKTIASNSTIAVVAGTQVTNATYGSVFINSSGLVAAVRSFYIAPFTNEFLYAEPSSAAVRVLGTGDQLNGGSIVSIFATSEMNEFGQVTLYFSLNAAGQCCPGLVVRVNPIATPTIASLSPTSGAVGTSVTIMGTNFTGATAVAFNGTAASFTVNSATRITATIPVGATTGPVAVTTPGGTATSSASFTVTLGPASTILSFTPASGGVGTSVTIFGTNLSGATSVTFNGTNATYKVRGSSQITAIVPAGATTGPIAVTTPGGVATSAVGFRVILAPTITDFSPTTGAVGTLVTITGTRFTGATAVKFNGSNDKSFSVVSDTTITTTVPKGTRTGPLSVTTPGGTATSASNFTVTR